MSVRVNDTVIDDHLINAEMQHHPASDVATARASAARALVVRELLLQAARRAGLLETAEDVSESEADEEAAIRDLLARELQLPEPDEASCRTYFENNPDRFRSPDLFEARHILLKAAPDDEAARADAKAKAEELIKVLASEPNRFADLAKAHSACPSAAQGGSLGQITRGQTVPEFETFLVALDPGQLCPVPVLTRYGYHVLFLDHRIDGKPLPFDVVRDKIADYLREHSWRTAVAQYLRVLAGKADIEGIDLDAAESPLVQ